MFTKDLFGTELNIQDVNDAMDRCNSQIQCLPFGVYYFGTRLRNGQPLVLVGDDAEIIGWLPPALDIWPITTTAFDWGNDSPGASQLALALLFERLADEPSAARAANDFKTQIVAKLPRASWNLNAREIARWLSKWNAQTPSYS